MAKHRITDSDAETLRKMRGETQQNSQWRSGIESGGRVGPPGNGNPKARQRFPDGGFWFKITGAVQQENEDGDKLEQWAYAGVQVYKKDAKVGGWATLPGGVTTSSDVEGDDPVAWNTLEDMNGVVNGGMTGGGFDTSTLPDNDPPDEDNPALKLLPIPVGAVVWARVEVCEDGTVEVHFSVPNAVGGTCPTSEES